LQGESASLVALTPMSSNASTPTPTNAASVATVAPTASVSPARTPGNRSVPNYPSLEQVYDLSSNVQGIIFALIFGFLAGIVINALQKEASLIMGQIQSTSPGQDGSG
jgi:fructose-specific phosphotransferase system IIC component